MHTFLLIFSAVLLQVVLVAGWRIVPGLIRDLRDYRSDAAARTRVRYNLLLLAILLWLGIRQIRRIVLLLG